jgi:hypothetical protein
VLRFKSCCGSREGGTFGANYVLWREEHGARREEHGARCTVHGARGGGGVKLLDDANYTKER